MAIFDWLLIDFWWLRPGNLLSPKCWRWRWNCKYTWPLNNMVLIWTGPPICGFIFPNKYHWLCYSQVSYLQIQPTTYRKQYFHIPNHGSPTADGKYYFLLGSMVGWIGGAKGILQSQKLPEYFQLGRRQRPNSPPLPRVVQRLTVHCLILMTTLWNCIIPILQTQSGWVYCFKSHNWFKSQYPSLYPSYIHTHTY